MVRQPQCSGWWPWRLSHPVSHLACVSLTGCTSANEWPRPQPARTEENMQQCLDVPRLLQTHCSPAMSLQSLWAPQLQSPSHCRCTYIYAHDVMWSHSFISWHRAASSPAAAATDQLVSRRKQILFEPEENPGGLSVRWLKVFLGEIVSEFVFFWCQVMRNLPPSPTTPTSNRLETKCLCWTCSLRK